MPNFVTQGTPTTTGGVVLEGQSTILIDGKPATSINQQASCASGRKSCKRIGLIVPVGGNDVAFLPNGLQAALTGYQVLCNCPDNFIQAPSNSVTVGFGGSGVYFGGDVDMGANVNINNGSGVSFSANNLTEEFSNRLSFDRKMNFSKVVEYRIESIDGSTISQGNSSSGYSGKVESNQKVKVYVR
ncbi:PAAR domain-containing protein [Photobacterium damselae]|uniref:PAAR domain-containing protein n=1 Tax=Photobacterium damselae TaxID=38293 RepID=UPI002F3FE22E